MLKKFTFSAAAIAAAGLAAPAMAQDATSQINVVVQPIAELTSTGVGEMIIDAPGNSFMGNPSSGGDDFSNVTTFELVTNFDVDGILFEFDEGVNAGEMALVGQTDGLILTGVPQAAPTDIIGGGTVHGASAAGELLVTNNDRDDPDQPFGPGTHEIGIGVSTNWTRIIDSVGGSLTGDVATPDTYVANVDATIVGTP
ncbi:hypothetical protein SAMN04490248_1484 [Salinihabitans flavidus]|uniref:Uncharacterized protein n=1 Tax=Salinihabitans flavidus TaxID=569882 RepID=A0A1H8W7W6_9RHOB|nr:hypothetical protein [Salinihabitans flavidus]SEP23721.1 hypothetical protein SAMN04490248_1484 [Salinihabitans flavidus]